MKKTLLKTAVQVEKTLRKKLLPEKLVSPSQRNKENETIDQSPNINQPTPEKHRGSTEDVIPKKSKVGTIKFK